MQQKSPRHIARQLAVQGIYLNIINHTSVIEIEQYLFENTSSYKRANYELLHSLLEQAILNFDEYLERFIPFLKRPLSEINPTEQAILVLAITELLNNLTVPRTVIINEAVELAKSFGGEDSYKFINGLVDKLAAEIRPNETKINRQ